MTPTLQYEFSKDENQTIAQAGTRARIWAILAVVVGVLQLLVGLATLARGGLAPLVNLASAPVNLVVGSTILGFASSLGQVVTTKGNDVGLMMGALQKLSKAFTIQIACVVVFFCAGVIAGAAGLR